MLYKCIMFVFNKVMEIVIILLGGILLERELLWILRILSRGGIVSLLGMELKR